MKRKLKVCSLILAVAVLLTTLAGCSIGLDSVEDIVEKNDLVSQVSYYSNGGVFNSNTVVRNIYYKENSKALEITEKTESVSIRHDEDAFVGWFNVTTATIDGTLYLVCDIEGTEAGEYVLDGETVVAQKNGEYVVSVSDYEALARENNVPLLKTGERFDFKNTVLQKGDRYYLASKWVPNQKIEFVLITEDGTSIEVNENGVNKVYNDGDVIRSELFDAEGTYVVSDTYTTEPVEANDATFVDFYVYSEGATVDNLTLLTDRTLLRPTDGVSNAKIFVKYVKGKWNVMRFADDVKSMFTDPNESYYLARDIDCTDTKGINPVFELYRGKIRGNGHVIKGINIQVTNLISGDKVALFGKMDSRAVIEDVTFEDITFTYTTRPMENSFVNIYLLCYAVNGDGNPTVNNVKIDGVELDITLNTGVNVENIPYGTSYDVSEWWYFGINNDDLSATFPTLTVENYELVINSQKITTDK